LMLRIRYWLVVTLLNRRELTLVLKPARTLHSATAMAGFLRSQNEVLSLDKRDRQSLFQDDPFGPSATLRRPRFSFFQSSIVKEQTNPVRLNPKPKATVASAGRNQPFLDPHPFGNFRASSSVASSAAALVGEAVSRPNPQPSQQPK
ncbi:hypothetical protein, partial [Mycoplana dimorpha]|uniref:hypothetical protein n=1 Tax=Mycoplana dimorpha TaxID=28320 RepID=UPI001AECA93F